MKGLTGGCPLGGGLDLFCRRELILATFWIESTGESVWIYLTLAADAVMQAILMLSCRLF